MNALMGFLLPSSTLDWIFCVLLLSWLLLSILAAGLARASVKKLVSSPRFAALRSDPYELDLATRHPFWDDFIEHAPGFALVLGLLGTFLGIGLAIQGAGSILADLNTNAGSVTDIRQTVGQLSPMLSEIGLKFKSSAWGVLVHIFIRLILPAFGVQRLRNNAVVNKLEKDLVEKNKAIKEEKDLFFALMGGISDLARNSNNVIDENRGLISGVHALVENQRNFFDSCLRRFADQKTENMILVEKIDQVIFLMSEQNNFLVSGYNEINQNIRSVHDSMDKQGFVLEGFVQAFEARADMIGSKLDGHQNELIKAVVDFGQSVHRDHLMALHKAEDFISMEKDYHENLFELFDVAQKEFVKGFGQQETNHEKILGNLESQISLLKKLGQTMNLSFEDQVKHNESSGKMLLKSEKHLSGMARVQESFGDNVDGLGNYVRDFGITVKDFQSSVGSVLNDMNVNMQTATSGLRQTVQEMKEEISSTFSDFKNNVSTTLKAVGSDINKSSHGIKISVESLSETMSREMNKINITIRDLETQSGRISLAMDKQEVVLKDFSDGLDVVRQSMARYTQTSNESMEVIEDAFSANGSLGKILTDIKYSNESVIPFLDKLTDSSISVGKVVADKLGSDDFDRFLKGFSRVKNDGGRNMFGRGKDK